METPICSTCDGENVLADCYAQWDRKTGEWVIQNVFEKGGYCEDCENETKISWKENEIEQ
jgi:hypothetical protein